MKIVKCTIHKDEFTLPTEKEEFLGSKLHGDVERLCEHHELYPKCRFSEGLKK